MRKAFNAVSASSFLSNSPMSIFALLIAVFVGQSLFFGDTSLAQSKQFYYRLQLKHGGQYLDADHCSIRSD